FLTMALEIERVVIKFIIFTAACDRLVPTFWAFLYITADHMILSNFCAAIVAKVLNVYPSETYFGSIRNSTIIFFSYKEMRLLLRLTYFRRPTLNDHPSFVGNELLGVAHDMILNLSARQFAPRRLVSHQG